MAVRADGGAHDARWDTIERAPGVLDRDGVREEGGPCPRLRNSSTNPRLCVLVIGSTVTMGQPNRLNDLSACWLDSPPAHPDTESPAGSTRRERITCTFGRPRGSQERSRGDPQGGGGLHSQDDAGTSKRSSTRRRGLRVEAARHQEGNSARASEPVKGSERPCRTVVVFGSFARARTWSEAATRRCDFMSHMTC